MQIRTILAAASGGSATSGVIEMGCLLARRFNSHLEVLHVRFDPRDMAALGADGFGAPLAVDLVEFAARESAETAAKAHGVFDAMLTKHGLPVREDPPPLGSDPATLAQASVCWHEEMGYSSTKVSDRARRFDLAILGRSGRIVDEPYSDAIEEALLTTGRPVLLAPSETPQTLGESIALAWNDSPQAAHALAAALPFLLKAREVHLLSLGETGAMGLAQHLAWYGIRAVARPVLPIDRVGPGELLLAAARDYGADLLVMGGYGRAPWREMLLGGATREIIGTSLLPLLLAH